MAANDRVSKLRLRFETTQSDINRARTDIRSLMTDIDALEQQQDGLNASYARSLQSQIASSRALDQNDAFVNSLRTDLGALADQQQQVNRVTDDGVSMLDRYRRAVDSVREAEQRRSGSVGGRTAGRLDQVDRFGRVGTQVLSGLGQGEAANAVGLVGDVADSFTKLNPVMLGVTAVTTGLALVYGHLREETQRVTEATAARIQAEAETARFLAAATTGQTRERIEALRNQIQVEEQLLEARRREEAEARGNLNAIDSLGLLLHTAYGEITAMTTATDQQNAAVTGLRTELDLLTTSFQNTDPVLAQLYGMIDAFEGIRETSQYANQLLYDQKQAQLEEAEARAQVIHETEQYVANLQYEAKVTAELNRQKGISDTTDQLFKLNEQLVELDNKDREAVEALAKSRQDAAEKLQQIDVDAEKERTKNINEAGKQRNKIIEDSEDHILDITRKAGRTILNAIGNRDALAAFQAKQQAQDQIDDEREAQSKRLKELQDNLRDQNQAVDERLQERRRIEEQRGREEIAVRFAAAQRTLTDLNNAQNAQLALQQQYHILAGQAAFQGGENLVVQFKMGMDSGLSKVGGLNSSGKQGYFYSAPQFSGTLAPSNSAPFNFSSSTQTPVNLNFIGETTGTMTRIGIREAQTQLGKLLTKLGYT
jgi:hypothetical protein